MKALSSLLKGNFKLVAMDAAGDRLDLFVELLQLLWIRRKVERVAAHHGQRADGRHRRLGWVLVVSRVLVVTGDGLGALLVFGVRGLDVTCDGLGALLVFGVRGLDVHEGFVLDHDVEVLVRVLKFEIDGEREHIVQCDGRGEHSVAKVEDGHVHHALSLA